jgi:hypothetical protein
MKFRQSTLFAEETLALRAPALAEIVPLSIPTCPVTFLPWSDDLNHGGWSARMFLHQMLSTSRPAWQCSDTESLPWRSTLAILRVRVGAGTTCVHAMTPEPPPLSSGLYPNPASLAGLARRAVKRKRPLQRVLLRTETGWRRKTLFVSSRGEGYEFYLSKRQKPSRDSHEAGLLDFLNDAVARWLERP